MTLRESVLVLARDRFSAPGEVFSERHPGYVILRHPNKKWFGIIMDLPRAALGLAGEGMVDALNVKCDPALIGSIRLQPGILPGYHMNKNHWITVLLDGTVPLSDVAALLGMSYDLVNSKKPKL